MNPSFRFRLTTRAALLAAAAGLSIFSTTVYADISFLGVAAGDATTSEAMLWTRAVDTNAPASVALLAVVVPNDPFSTNGMLTFPVVTDTNKDYTAKVQATGLQAGTRYFYWFTDGVVFSKTGTFKTAPASNSLAPVRFGFSGDMDGLMRPYALASTVPAQQLDFYLNCGDVIYETASSVAGNNGAPWLNSPSVTLSGSAATLNDVPVGGTTFATHLQLFSDYSKKYREQFLPVNSNGQNCLQDFYAGQGNYTLNDNHELGNRQYINGGAPAGGSVGGPAGADMPTGRGVDARDNGTGNISNTNDAADLLGLPGAQYMNRSQGFQSLQQVYLNFMPVNENRAGGGGLINAPTDPRSDGTKQLYFAQQWGQNAIYVQTDARAYRDIRLKSTNGSADDTGLRADNAARTYLGTTQMAWLKQTLLAADQNGTPWKFVAVSDPVDAIGPVGGALSGTLTSVNADGGKAFIGGYRAERNGLLKFIADNKIKNVVFLSTDDHQNRINEVTYSPSCRTGPGSAGFAQSDYMNVPFCFSIVCGPLGATGPDTITNHSFSNVKAIADDLATKQAAAGVEPIGLAGYPGLHDVVRDQDGVLVSEAAPQPADFYSPDTFNFNVLDVSADGKTLTVSSAGINSTAQNSAWEYNPVANPMRELFSFKIDAASAPEFTSCPGAITVSNDAGQCSATVTLPVAATGLPAPVVTCAIGGVPISSTYTFAKGVTSVTCTASNSLGVATCSFNVTVVDAEAPVSAVSNQTVSGDVVSTLLASDNCDGTALQIFVKDSAQGPHGGSFSAGPYAPSTKVKLARHPNKDSVSNGSGGTAASIKTVGNPLLVVTDAAGNTSYTVIPVNKN